MEVKAWWLDMQQSIRFIHMLRIVFELQVCSHQGSLVELLFMFADQYANKSLNSMY